MESKRRRDEELPGQIGKRLQLLREFLALDQGTTARKLGIPQSSLSNYEVGRRRPSLQLLADLQDRFRVSLNWLLTGRGNWRLELAEPKDAQRRGGRGPLDADDEVLLDRIRQRLEAGRGRRGPFRPVIVLAPADSERADRYPEASRFRAVPVTGKAEAIGKQPPSPESIEGHTVIPAEVKAKTEWLRALRIEDSRYAPVFPKGTVIVLDVAAQSASQRSLEHTVLLIWWRHRSGEEEGILVRLMTSEPYAVWEPIVKGGPQPDALAAKESRWLLLGKAIWTSHPVV